MRQNKKWLCVVLIIVCMITMIGLVSCKNGDDEIVQALPFIATDEVVIAHLTDTHYYPLNYCFSGNIANTDYESQIKTGKKMVLESSAINIQAINEIADQTPDYLVLTGDITSDGEIQSHIEMANLLRQLQNNVRTKSNKAFQIFVTIGNHDVYNRSARHYRNGGERTQCTLTTRYDITKIYSSLGYPDLTDNEIESYYDTLTDIFYDNLPYDNNFINSTTASSVRIEYQYLETDIIGGDDFEKGEISYIAYCPNNYIFIAIDEEISDAVVNHYGGGLFYDNTKDFLSAKKADDKFVDKTLVGLMHHNAVPHFKGEDTLLKDFTIYGWKETTDFLADLGIRYIFTGHMHSNDIATHTSFNGNLINDIETSSTIGYKGGTRYCKLERGDIAGDYAENFSSWIDLVDSVDFTKYFDESYFNIEYIQQFKLSHFITQTNDQYICNDPSEYAATRVFANVVSYIIEGYLSPSYLANLSTLVSSKLTKINNSILKNLGTYVDTIITNIFIHIEDVVLKDYQYNGDNPLYLTTELGAKTCGYVDDLLTTALNMEVNTKGDKMLDFAIGCYLQHMGGMDTSFEDASPDHLEALQNFKSGLLVNELISLILNKETGLYPILEGLTQPMDLAKGMTPKEAKGLTGIFSLFAKKNIDIDPHAIILDNHINEILTFLEGMGLFSLDIGNATIKEAIDKAIDSFVTDSFNKSLGENVHNILYNFSIDPTSKLETNFDKYVLYKYDTSLPSTYLSTAPKELPSIANGKLPSMLTVSFGKEPKKEKNFVWFTDRRIKGTDIQYMTSAFDASKATTESGEYDVYATTTGNMDLGVFSTLMHIEIGYHCVELTSLQPGTTYNYRVGSAEDDLWSEIFSFSTAPNDNEKFELLLMTDLQGSGVSTYEKTAQIMSNVEKVFKNGYDFVINCGDMVDDSRNLAHWEYFLDTLQPYWGNTTQVVATGNHDKYTYEKVTNRNKEYSLIVPNSVEEEYNYYLLHYKLNYPIQKDTSGAYYSFDYSGVHFTVLNTNDIDTKKQMSQQQIDWLIGDLTTTDKDFKVIIMHKGLYTAGAHSSDADIVKMRAQLTPIFAENKVQLVLQGHDHTYTESFYLDENGKPIVTKATGKSKIGDQGTLYITLGTMGDKFYNYVENKKVPIEFGQDLHDRTLANPTFGKLVYDGKDLYYYGYEYNLENDKITKLRGWLWWNYALTGAGAFLVISCSTVGIILVRKRKINK